MSEAKNNLKNVTGFFPTTSKAGTEYFQASFTAKTKKEYLDQAVDAFKALAEDPKGYMLCLFPNDASNGGPAFSFSIRPKQTPSVGGGKKYGFKG